MPHHLQHRLAPYTTVILTVLIILIAIIPMFTGSGLLLAQDEVTATPVVEQASEVPPASEPTEAAPAEAPPTSEPTDIPPTEAATAEVPPTTEPTEALPTEAEVVATEEIILLVPVSETPTVEALQPLIPAPMAPVFEFTDGMHFSSSAGTPLIFHVRISDEIGAVSTIVDMTSTHGSVEVTAAAPVETVAPFYTLVTVTYTAPADYQGTDEIRLVASDSTNLTAVAIFAVDVFPAVVPVTEQPAATKELLIAFNPSAPEAAIQSMLQGLNAVEVSRLPQIGVIKVRVPDVTAQPSTAMATLQSTRTATLAGVTSVEANGAYQLFYTPNDPSFGTQWGLKQGPGGIFAEYAWNTAIYRGSGITIAVLDGGVDLQHPELLYQLVPGWDFVNDDNTPDDDTAGGHGTHIAGIIAARTNNMAGVAGVAFNARIMPVKVCDAATSCSMYYVAAGIVHAVDKGARIINLSLGSMTPSSTVEAAINYALSRNVVVVAAAGNIGGSITDGTLVYPASYPGVISVAAHDSTGTRAVFSNSNNMVDISAPGAGIYSLLPVESGSYGTLDGTSMSSAFVSGTAALIISANVANTPATVLDALTCGAQDAGPVGFDNEYGYGRLQADVSLNWKLNSSSCKITLANDRFETPMVVTYPPFTAVQPIHSRSVTAQTGDPAPICAAVAPVQTLWYSFKPTISGNYQISTLGSSYDAVFGIYQGNPGQWSRIGCSTSSVTSFPLQAYQQYYIVVGTSGAAVDDQVLELRVHAAIPSNNLLHQEYSTSIAFPGMWTQGYVAGASGGYTRQTTDVNAVAAFTFRGTAFDYFRTVGPTQGQALVYFNDDPTPVVVDNRGALAKPYQVKNILVPGATAGQWNTVRIIRDATVPGGIDLDAINTYDFDSTTVLYPIVYLVDDRSTQLRYNAGSTSTWSNVTVATSVAYLGTLKQVTDPTASVVFRTSGNAITITRMTGTGFAPMQVIVDNGTPIIIDNTAATNAVRPYTIDGLVTMTHVVEIRKVGTVGDGLVLQLDSIQSLTMYAMYAGYQYDDRVTTSLAYRGTWTDTGSVAGAYGWTIRTLNENAQVSFLFTGNDLCVGYRQPTGALDVFIDEAQVATIPASGGSGFVKWCLDANAGKLAAAGTHYARLVVPAGNTFVLDYVRPQNYNTLTPARGLVQELDTGFRYTTPADWLYRITLSAGGYYAQGGYLRSTSTDNTTVSFYITGSGFILYTVVGPDRGCWEVTVDGVLYEPEPGVAGIDLLDPLRYRPLGYGVVGLIPGTHLVVLKADTNCSSIGVNAPSSLIVDLDAVRVFP